MVYQRWATISLLSGLIAKISEETDCVQSLQRNGQTIPVQEDANLSSKFKLKSWNF